MIDQKFIKLFVKFSNSVKRRDILKGQEFSEKRTHLLYNYTNISLLYFLHLTLTLSCLAASTKQTILHNTHKISNK